MRYLGSRSLECSFDSVKRDKVGRVASDEVAYIDSVNISKCIYTVGHKKRATIFLTITSAFLDRFQHFVFQWKKE